MKLNINGFHDALTNCKMINMHENFSDEVTHFFNRHKWLSGLEFPSVSA